MSTTHHDQQPIPHASPDEFQPALFDGTEQNLTSQNLDPTVPNNMQLPLAEESQSDTHLPSTDSEAAPVPVEDPIETPVQPEHRMRFTRKQQRIAAGVLAVAVGAGVAGYKALESGSPSSHAQGTTATQPSPRSTSTETTAATSSPTPTSIPTSTATAGGGTEQGGTATSENLATLPESVTAVAEKYGLQLKTVSYDVYPEGTRKYAQAKGLPDHYYDLTTLNTPLTLEDYKALAPVFLTNLFVEFNTNNVHFMDMGNGTQFGNETTPTPPPYLFAPDSGKDQWGEATGFGTFNLTPDNVKVYEAPYDGPLTKYEGQTVIHVDFTNIHVREISSQGLNGGYIDTIGEQTGSYPDLGNSSADGPFLIQSLQFDPATNNVIAHSFTNRY